MRTLSESGSKVITDPGELGPDFLELLLQWCVGDLGHRVDGSLAAPMLDAPSGLLATDADVIERRLRLTTLGVTAAVPLG